MPTLEHNALIEMFRENPPLAAHLLSLLFHADIPRHTSARVADATLDQLLPIEFRADLVLELLNEAGKVIFAIIFEMQREKKPRKKYSWPVYLAVARAERECPTALLVLAVDEEIAAWAAEKIDLGVGRGTIEPFVLGPRTTPVVTESVVAETQVELAILSAIAHGNGPQGLDVVQTALAALGRLDRELAAVYFQLIWDALREPMQRALEAMVMEKQTEGKTTFPPFAQRIFERGAHEGRLDGIREGELKGKRDALLALVADAGVALSEGEVARIQACSDGPTLDRWIRNVLRAKSADEILS